MIMVDEKHVLELLPAYALRVLDEEEMLHVSGHLATCSGCRAELASFQEVADRLALGAPDAAPPLRLKQQIMERVQSPRVAPATSGRAPWWERLTGLFQRSAPIWGLASLVLIVALVAVNLMLWQRLSQSAGVGTQAGMHVVALVGTDVAPDATGTLVISADGEYGTLVVDGLPWLEEGYQYQLWLIRDGQRTSGGAFSVNAEGYGALEIQAPEPLASYPTFGITIEPTGGSPGPTGDKVLGTGL